MVKNSQDAGSDTDVDSDTDGDTDIDTGSENGSDTDIDAGVPDIWDDQCSERPEENCPVGDDFNPFDWSTALDFDFSFIDISQQPSGRGDSFVVLVSALIDKEAEPV
ncbi:MAG: hypothetical protein GY847_39415, partial [Proteobacteria bacterium]|nr:hypothetical protein [Pseudomonadota bacterium]